MPPKKEVPMPQKAAPRRSSSPGAAPPAPGGREIAVIAQGGWSWIPSAGDPGTVHSDVEPCTVCRPALFASGRSDGL
ncbi:MAG TPA: hypothetical protein VI542_04060 [Candidatus Tectomicrobia bacterium]